MSGATFHWSEDLIRPGSYSFPVLTIFFVFSLTKVFPSGNLAQIWNIKTSLNVVDIRQKLPLQHLVLARPVFVQEQSPTESQSIQQDSATLQVQWRSEYRTSLVFEWSKRGLMPIGQVFECHLNTRQPNHLNFEQMDTILFSYKLVRYLNGQPST